MSYNILNGTKKLLFSIYFYREKKVLSIEWLRVTCDLNNFHILVYQIKYSKILLMKDNLYEWEMWSFLWEFVKDWIPWNIYEFKSWLRQKKKKHNSENQQKYLDKKLCEYYCLGLHKRLSSSKHCIHYLAE
jgi:hypothetical protein